MIPNAAYENDWRNDAACLNTDPEMFFSSEKELRQDRSNAMNTKHLIQMVRTRQAKEICNGIPGKTPACPVREECLAYALATQTEYGVFGGMTGNERRSLRRRQLREGKKQVSFYE